MEKIPTSLGARGLGIFRLAAAAFRLAKSDERAVEENARRFLALSMGRLRGLPQKIGQILAMGDSETAEAMAPLTGAGTPLPSEVVERVLAAEWKRPPNQVVEELSAQGLAASLGQVHRGRLKTGEEVAIKVQYPGIAKAIAADLKLLGWLSAPLGGFRRGFNLQGYREELLRDLEEELDYVREAENQHQYHFLSQFLPNLVVPRVFGQLTTSRVLVCAWEDGSTLEEAAGWSLADRKAAGRVFLGHSLETLFRHGFSQADLHPGNFRFRKTPRGEIELVLYDFGCVFRAPLPARLALLKLIEMTEANASDDPYPFFLELGFDPGYLEPIAEKLPALCRILFAPFILNAPWEVERWELGKRVEALLGPDRWNFRIAAPPNLIFLMRCFHGMLHAIGTLGVALPWRALLMPIREHFAAEVAKLSPREAPRTDRSFGRLAKHLMISVREGGTLKVRLTSPVHVIDHLEESIDEAVMRQIREQNIDLNSLVRRVQQSGYLPQPIFSLDNGVKEVRVWLE